MTEKRNTAAEILKVLIEQGENIAEYCLALEEGGHGGDAIMARIHKAYDLEYWDWDGVGGVALTARGQALLNEQDDDDGGYVLAVKDEARGGVAIIAHVNKTDTIEY